MQRHAYELVVVVQTFGSSRPSEEAKSSKVRQLSGLRVPFSMLLFCLVSTSLSAPCPLKGHVAPASLSFINGMSVGTILCCSSVRAHASVVHLRRGLRPLLTSCSVTVAVACPWGQTKTSKLYKCQVHSKQNRRSSAGLRQAQWCTSAPDASALGASSNPRARRAGTVS
jgi:hypothetical protein